MSSDTNLLLHPFYIYIVLYCFNFQKEKEGKQKKKKKGTGITKAVTEKGNNRNTLRSIQEIISAHF